MSDVSAQRPNVIDEVQSFFVFYNQQKGVRFTPLRRAGAAAARRVVAVGRHAAPA